MQPGAGKSSLADAEALPVHAKIAVIGRNQPARPCHRIRRAAPTCLLIFETIRMGPAKAAVRTPADPPLRLIIAEDSGRPGRFTHASEILPPLWGEKTPIMKHKRFIINRLSPRAKGSLPPEVRTDPNGQPFPTSSPV